MNPMLEVATVSKPSLMLIAALLGFIWIELAAVYKSLVAQGVRFSLGYYLRHNILLLIMNAIGTTMVYLMAPAATIALRWFIHKWTNDEGLVQVLSDYVLAPVTGGLIGLMGAWLVRRMVTRVKMKINNATDANEGGAPPADPAA